ncbi:MAG: ABC transporter permease [Actinomycetales bacterium]
MNPPDAPSLVRLSVAQGRWEVRSTLRNGEQLLLILGIPVLLILVGSWLPGLGIAPARDGIAPMVAASVLACGFTSLAIATAFERRSAALTFLATTPLGRLGLLAGKVIAVGLVSCISIVAVVVAGLFVGWRPADITAGGLILILVALTLAGIACTAWGLLLAGVLRAEAVLAVANALFLALVFLGGIAVPLSALPSAWSRVAQYLPTGALITALRSDQATMATLVAILALVLWSLLGSALALRYFRWDDRR